MGTPSTAVLAAPFLSLGGMSVARITALAAAASLCSCAYFTPMVGTIRTTGPAIAKSGDAKSPPVPNAMPALAEAVLKADAKVSEMETKRNWTIGTGRFLDFATFGLAAGAIGAGLHGHHINSVTNLSFSSGLSYVGSRLFSPLDVAVVYNNGAKALSCVTEKGATVQREVSSAQATLLQDAATNVPMSLLAPTADCKRSPELDAALSDALTQQRELRAVVDHLIATDPDQGNLVVTAANKIISNVDDEIIKRSNSGDAIASSLKGLGAPNIGLVVPSEKVATGKQNLRGREDACTPESLVAVQKKRDEYKAAQGRVTSGGNALATLETACAVAAPAIAALTIDTEEVTVAKDGRVNVTISGGREPYVVTATGTTSPNVDVQLVPPRTIVVMGKSTISGASGPFTYQVRDNSAISTPKTLKINTK